VFIIIYASGVNLSGTAAATLYQIIRILRMIRRAPDSAHLCTLAPDHQAFAAWTASQMCIATLVQPGLHCWS
jgi:hypothetical protein